MSDETLLGTVLDADTDPVHVYAGTDGVVVLRWEHGADMAFGRTGRDKLRELLDRAAMPGQVTLPRAERCPRCSAADPARVPHQALCPHVWHDFRAAD